MSSQIALFDISAAEEAIRLDVTLFSTPATQLVRSPIDDFYDHLKSLVLIGTSEALTQHSMLGRVLLLGIVSATEYYFRSVISGVLYVCPLAHSHAHSEGLTFGAIDYYAKPDLGFALLENHSFSSGKEIRNQTKRLLNLEWQETSSLGTAVKEFDKLCQFRHAATHSRGDIASKNFYEIALSSLSGRLSVSVGFEGFQDAAGICRNVVRAYNRHVFEKTLDKWMTSGKLKGTWNKDHRMFEGLFDLFRSSDDLPNATAREAHDLVRSALRARLQPNAEATRRRR